MLLVLPKSMVKVKESRHLMRHLKLHLLLDCFPQKYTENETVKAIVSTLKQAPDRKERGVPKKGLEVVSADFNAHKIEKDNWLNGLEEEEDTSGDSIKEMLGV